MEAPKEFQVLARLAKGGMAEIYLARKANAGGFERYVVLKRILPDRAHDQRFVAMFLDEVRLAAQLQHPNIAQVHDIGKLGDSYFFTMEYVHGETVRAVFQRQRVMPISCALAIVVGTASGLHHAHERIGIDGRPLGIVHRDVSPSNLMISFEGNIKVVDFGIAKAADRMTQTRSGLLKGKINYLSPEQCRLQSLDRRSDLFSLGIVMWELLAGERLYRRASDFESMEAIVNEAPAAPSSQRADVSPELDRIVLRLLAKDRDQRYATAAKVIEDIEAAAVQTGIAISTLALARFMRTVFGPRPEPWIELSARTEVSEVVRVRSEPSTGEPSRSDPSPVEKELAAVGELSLTTPIPIVEPDPDPVELRPTQPVKPVEPRRALPWRWIMVGCVAASAVAGALIGTCQSRSSDPPQPPPAVSVMAIPERTPADAAVTIDAATIDAALDDQDRADDQSIVLETEAPPKAPAAQPARKERSRTEAELVRMFQQNRLEEAWARCASLATMIGQSATVCVLTACHLKDERAARLWLGSAAANKRAALIARCRALGLVLDTAQR